MASPTKMRVVMVLVWLVRQITQNMRWWLVVGGACRIGVNRRLLVLMVLVVGE